FLGASWWQLLVAAFLGVMSTQVAMLGHDAGHKQVTRTRASSYLIGITLGNLLTGLSFGWWIDKHNRHHAHPNHEELDPAVDPAVFGFYMGCSFAPNHKGMPPLTDEEEKDYLRRQVLTSRNVRGGVLTDWTLGGLNYQIEHHLFPSMPRPSLRLAKPVVEQ